LSTKFRKRVTYVTAPVRTVLKATFTHIVGPALDGTAHESSATLSAVGSPQNSGITKSDRIVRNGPPALTAASRP
jgi:hypothetical protein